MRYAIDPRFRAIPGTSSPLELRAMVQNPFAFFEERYLKHGPIFRSSLVYPVVWMMGAEANRTIMVSGRENFSYAGGYGQLAFGKLFQQNILLLDGEEHLRTRTLLEPAVNRLGLGEVIDQVQSIWDSAADKLERRPHGDVYDIAQRATFEASAMALTGLKDGSELDAMRPHFEAMIVGAMAHTKLRYPNGILDRGLKSRDVLVDMLRPHIERARRDPEPKGFLGRLAQDKDEHGRYLPIEDVIHHTMLLFWAGYDTTASAGSWVLHLLAHHPEWQDRIRENVWDALGDEPYQLKGSAKLTTLSWFLREVERCGPSLTMFPRTAMRDFEFGGYTVPAGTPVFWSPWMSQRCPEAFPHPHAFDPGRWDPARGEDQAKGKYMVGFGGGPRLCLGRNFAQMQLRILVTTLVRRFHIEPDATRPFTIQGLPTHHPVDSYVHFRPLLAYQERGGRARAALAGARSESQADAQA